MSPGRPFPLIASGSAFLFTLYNGLMQVKFALKSLWPDRVCPVTFHREHCED